MGRSLPSQACTPPVFAPHTCTAASCAAPAAAARPTAAPGTAQRRSSPPAPCCPPASRRGTHPAAPAAGWMAARAQRVRVSTGVGGPREGGGASRAGCTADLGSWRRRLWARAACLDGGVGAGGKGGQQALWVQRTQHVTQLPVKAALKGEERGVEQARRAPHRVRQRLQLCPGQVGRSPPRPPHACRAGGRSGVGWP